MHRMTLIYQTPAVGSQLTARSTEGHAPAAGTRASFLVRNVGKRRGVSSRSVFPNCRGPGTR